MAQMGAPDLSAFLPGGPLAGADDARPNLVGMDLAEMAEALEPLGLPAFRAKQIFRWVYLRGATSFSEMTDLSKALRDRLEAAFRVGRPRVAADRESQDGTRKWLFRYDDGNEAETVFIPEADRGTLCVSSQVGCTLTCTFCHTGTQRLVRNLTAGEILVQVMAARDRLDGWPSPAPDRDLTNIVLMGMGEPLYNTDNVIKAMRLAMDGEGIGISRRRITLSTSGVVPDIARVGAELNCGLAISLHAVTDELRDLLVPINRKYPLEALIAACRAYPGLTNARRITWEYVMLKGVNDSDADARALARLIDGIPSKVNLIPFNPWPGSDYDCSDAPRVQAFADILWKAGYSAPIRAPRGRDILAACGQLKSESQRLSRRERDALARLKADKEAALGIARAPA